MSNINICNKDHVNIDIRNNRFLDINIMNNENLDVNIDKCNHLTLRITQPLSCFEIILNGVPYILSDDGTTLRRR